LRQSRHHQRQLARASRFIEGASFFRNQKANARRVAAGVDKAGGIDLGTPSPRKGSFCLRKATASRFTTKTRLVYVEKKSRPLEGACGFPISTSVGFTAINLDEGCGSGSILWLGARIVPEAQRPSV
jgi:hypothetical protein